METLSRNHIEKIKRAPILIVEDNEDDFYFAKRALQKASFENDVHRVVTGEEALEYLGAEGKYEGYETPVLVLLDLNLPGLDGKKVLSHMRNNARLKKVPVIILSTSDDELDIQFCYDLGANSYIQKPVDFKGLIAAFEVMNQYWFDLVMLPKEVE